jgi:hypothetical protein
MRDDDDDSVVRPLVAGLGVLLGVALIIGGLIAVVALGAVKMSGAGDSDGKPAAEPSLYIPERTPTESAEPGAGESSPATAPTESATPPPKRKPPRKVISLSASPVEVSSMEQIYLTGTYPRAEGAQLQVQRLEGSWEDFPSSASVTGGTFTTYVRTGQPGVNRFRVVDRESGKASNPVSVRVR